MDGGCNNITIFFFLNPSLRYSKGHYNIKNHFEHFSGGRGAPRAPPSCQVGLMTQNPDSYYKEKGPGVTINQLCQPPTHQSTFSSISFHVNFLTIPSLWEFDSKAATSSSKSTLNRWRNTQLTALKLVVLIAPPKNGQKWF